jgi:putative membrane protein
MRKILSQITAAYLGLWVASSFVDKVVITFYADSSFFGIPINAQWQMLLVLAITLGLLNYFIGPVLKTITLPLRIITLGLFNILINMGLLWFLDLIFDEVSMPLILPLLYTTLVIGILNIILKKILVKKEED